MHAIATPPPRTMWEVYQLLPEGTMCQIINNQLIMSPAPNNEHQKTSATLFVQLMAYIQKHKLGEARYATYDVFINKKQVYQPDILFVANKNVHKIQENGLHGAPDFVIELLSPSTAKYDLEDKKEIYEQAGVAEYWVVNPADKQVWGYQLIEGVYETIESQNGEIVSPFFQTTFIF
jgi:Uma2 family endonuclease